MQKLIVTGGRKLKGTVNVSGAKNVALKTLVGACLTGDEVIIRNVPLVSDLRVMINIIKELGGNVRVEDHTVRVKVKKFKKGKIALDEAAQIRTSFMFMAPLLARIGRAVIPNPGGCRIGNRPIDRVVKGLKALGVGFVYKSNDGYFYLNKQGSNEKRKSITYAFEKNTHTGTETLILYAALSDITLTLKNSALEPEVDDLIKFLNQMGAKIKRTGKRTIVVEGVKKLHGTDFTISPDRNEIVTFAVSAIITKGDVFIENAHKVELSSFLKKLEIAGAGIEIKKDGIRFFYKDNLKSVSVETSFYPGFMTDWQGPWAVLMTQAKGVSIIHETVYENRFGYVSELVKMGAHIKLFTPAVKNPEKLYNFNLSDIDSNSSFYAEKVSGPTKLHNGAVKITDLRAGATLVLGAMSASGVSIIFGVEHLDRGYEDFDKRLNKLGADIKREAD